MKLRFPLDDVNIEISSFKKEVSNPLFTDEFYTLNQNEFSMDIPNVGWFFASGGNYVSLHPYPDANKNSIELYLNGSVYGAILHQRKILPLHGSSFIWNGKGILICGETGVGKSSLTASFCLNGAEFHTDDVTPVIIEDDIPKMLGLSDRIKLWDDSLAQMEISKEGLQKIDMETEKYFYSLSKGSLEKKKLDKIIILQTGEISEFIIQKLNGANKFQELRNQIYRREYLNGMKESEKAYFNNIVCLSNKVDIFKIKRPEKVEISLLSKFIEDFIDKGNL